MSQISQATFSTPLQTITGDVGGAVSPAAGNINLLGTLGEITVTGFPGANTLVLSIGATVPLLFSTDAGDAVPALNTLTIAGGTNIGTSGAGSTVTVNLDPTITLTQVNATTFDTNNLASGLTLSGTTLSADGTDLDIDLNITSKSSGGTDGNVIINKLRIPSGTGDIFIDSNGIHTPYIVGKTLEIAAFDNDGPSMMYGLKMVSGGIAGGTWTCDLNTLTTIGTNYIYRAGGTDIPVTDGGTGASTLLDHGILVGSGTSAITPLAVGGTGVILQGSAAADPAWSTATYPSTVAIGDVLVASAANVIGAVAGAATAGYLLTANGAGTAPTFQAPPAGVTYASDAETLAGTVTNKAVAPASLKAKLGLQTLHALPVGNSDSLALDWLAVGNDGTVLVGNSAADPSFSASPRVTTIYATTFDTDVVAAAVTLSGTTLSADGTNADININITAKGTGQVIIDDLQLTTDLAVTEGGTGASTLTDHGILLGSGTGAITPLGVAANGEIPIGSAGADPVLATITASTNIQISNGAGTITVSSTAVGINDQTDSYQLVAGDAGKLITMTKASANTLTVPKDATVNFAVGTQILVYQGGAGVTTIAPEDAGITIRSAGGLLDLFAQYSTCGLVKIAANLWVLAGDLA